jgi:GT2 family glycosyltransferase
MISSLPPALLELRRGSYIGRLELLDGELGLVGWAARLPNGVATPAPLEIQLVLEDLLDPAGAIPLATVRADSSRPDLRSQGIEVDCGFRFQGSLDLELPSQSGGLVLRAYFDTLSRTEIPGSPVRLDGERYEVLQQICRSGSRGRARLGPVEGPFACGWAVGDDPLQLRVDAGEPLPVDPPQPLPGLDWAFRLALPTALCDGNPHHLLLETTAGQPLDERIELLPFQLTPWGALQEHGRPPFPDQLSPLAREHYRSLHTWLSWADADGTALPADLPLLQRLLSGPAELGGDADAGTEAGPDGSAVPRQSLHLPLADEPLVSIVVPVHGHYAITRRCLAALAYAPTRVPFELIVVDDGSPDATAEFLAIEAPGVRVERHAFARGFNQACCTGAAASRGRFIVLLNNDTEPCARWLEELLDPFERWPDTGLVGAQLIHPDGRLQEAGGIVWGNGEPWNYGRGGNPYDPRYAYARQIDYASGAALAIQRSLWNQVGGFSPEFSPAYFEDTDLAFKVRQAGFTVRYAPLCRVIHHEGVSNGTDTDSSSGLKRYQALHDPLFRSKWAEAFEGSSEPDLQEAERIKDRGIVGRALFIDHETPRPDRDAGSHAALVEMELVQALGWKISFFPANLAWLGGYSEDLQRRGIEVLHAPFVLSLDQLLRERGDEFDLIYLTRYTVATAALPLITEHAPRARRLFCNADLHHLRELRAARAAGLQGEEQERALAAVREVRRLETAAMRQMDLTFSYSEVERAVIEAETQGEVATAACPWVVEGPGAPAPLEGRQGLAFLGSYNHPPNREAVGSFLEQVWPGLRERSPALRLHLYGSHLPPDLARAWAAIPGVVVAGWVADPASVYARHRIFVAPLRSGAGLKGKVVAAAAHGIPQVLSPLAAEATGLRDGQEVAVARGPEQWIEAILRLEADEAAWRAMSEAAFSYAARTWSRARGLQLMAEALQQLDLPLRLPA